MPGTIRRASYRRVVNSRVMLPNSNVTRVGSDIVRHAEAVNRSEPSFAPAPEHGGATETQPLFDGRAYGKTWQTATWTSTPSSTRNTGRPGRYSRRFARKPPTASRSANPTWRSRSTPRGDGLPPDEVPGEIGTAFAFQDDETIAAVAEYARSRGAGNDASDEGATAAPEPSATDAESPAETDSGDEEDGTPD